MIEGGSGRDEQLGQQVHAPHVGELVIEQDDVRLGRRGERQLRAPDVADPAVALHFQQVPHQPRHRRIVLDQENGDVHALGHRATTRCQRRVHVGVDDGADQVGHPLHGLRGDHRFLVGPRRGERVVDLHRADDPGAHRDVLAREPVGIALAVPALVVAAHEADHFAPGG